jgi:outer membrane protein assembly factor BamB
LGDDIVYYNTNLGAVAALRASDGRLQWLCRYPRRGLADRDSDQDDRHWFRDQTPCLLHQDLVIVAPADCDRILALDAATGRIVWATAAGAAADAVHLMGVAHGSLLASGDYLYWIDAQTGRMLHQFPALRSPLTGYAAPDPRGYGRGVLAGDQVLWPTYDSIYVFDQAGGHQLRQRIDLGSMGLTGGNLVIDGHTLLIAAAGQLVALNTWGRPLEPSAALTGGDAR